MFSYVASDAASRETSVGHVGTMTTPETGRPADCSTGTTAPISSPVPCSPRCRPASPQSAAPQDSQLQGG
ncbi:hypothetical protein J6590_091014 [Homalodisca vitripennis]|nr:hypothetical protein J6590_072674 [Homalodisca vitripennis]KAG8334414.1 hypothetical protein J6590_091014 [Homalodisca vitripennis]